MNHAPNERAVVLPAAGKQPGEHVWTHGADVQALWRKHGWTPPSLSRRDYSQPARTTHIAAIAAEGSAS